MSKDDPYEQAAALRRKQMERVVFQVDATVISSFDQWAARKGCVSRAEALRALVDAAVRDLVKTAP